MSAPSAAPTPVDRRQALIDVVFVYSLFTLIVTIVGMLSVAWLPARPGAELEPTASNLLADLWSRWDSG